MEGVGLQTAPVPVELGRRWELGDVAGEKVQNLGCVLSTLSPKMQK